MSVYEGKSEDVVQNAVDTCGYRLSMMDMWIVQEQRAAVTQPIHESRYKLDFERDSTNPWYCSLAQGQRTAVTQPIHENEEFGRNLR